MFASFWLFTFLLAKDSTRIQSIVDNHYLNMDGTFSATRTDQNLFYIDFLTASGKERYFRLSNGRGMFFDLKPEIKEFVWIKDSSNMWIFCKLYKNVGYIKKHNEMCIKRNGNKVVITYCSLKEINNEPKSYLFNFLIESDSFDSKNRGEKYFESKHKLNIDKENSAERSNKLEREPKKEFLKPEKAPTSNSFSKSWKVLKFISQRNLGRQSFVPENLSSYDTKEVDLNKDGDLTLKNANKAISSIYHDKYIPTKEQEILYNNTHRNKSSIFSDIYKGRRRKNGKNISVYELSRALTRMKDKEKRLVSKNDVQSSEKDKIFILGKIYQKIEDLSNKINRLGNKTSLKSEPFEENNEKKNAEKIGTKKNAKFKDSSLDNNNNQLNNNNDQLYSGSEKERLIFLLDKMIEKIEGICKKLNTKESSKDKKGGISSKISDMFGSFKPPAVDLAEKALGVLGL